MSGNVVPATAADPSLGSGAPQSDPAAKPVAPPAEASTAVNPADLRLIIDEVGSPGNYLYTVVDQRTGKIVSQLPQNELVRMKEQPDYTAGAVFDGQA
jgi:flagellar protein FlaG